MQNERVRVLLVQDDKDDYLIIRDLLVDVGQSDARRVGGPGGGRVCSHGGPVTRMRSSKSERADSRVGRGRAEANSLGALLLSAKDFATPVDRPDAMLRALILLETRCLFRELAGE